MKKLLLLYICFFSGLIWGQSQTVQINWLSPQYYNEAEVSKIVPFFSPQNYNFNPVTNTLLYIENVNISTAVDPGSLQISNIQYETIGLSELKTLEVKDLPKTIGAVLSNRISRGQYSLTFSFSPIVHSEGSIKRVRSLQYSYRPLPASSSTLSPYTQGRTQSSSVLKSGPWMEFEIEKSGVYKMSKTFLSQLGVPADVDPRTIKIYGNGGRMLPLLNSAPYPEDLQENAIQFVGADLAKLTEADYFLFYAEGVDQWSAENLTHLNLYASKAKYYVTYGGQPGRRMSELHQPQAAAAKTYENYDGYAYHESDLINIGRLGRKWFGENFGMQNQQSFTLDLPNRDASSAVTVTINTASASFGNTSFSFQANNQSLGSVSFRALNGQTTKAYENFFSRSAVLAAGPLQLTLTYNSGGVPTSEGFLDYIGVAYTGLLRGGTKQYVFENASLATEPAVVQYAMSDASSVYQIWDISDIYNVASLQANHQPQVRFKVQGGTHRRFHTVVLADLYEPMRSSNTRIQNQNIKQALLDQGDLDYLIVTHSALKPAAERLANFHRTHSQLIVKVVDLEQIYREFSSGQQDVAAIRNLVKYLYNNASAPDRRIKYLNLFGDASFDYKNRIPNNSNVVPVFYGMDLSQITTTGGQGGNFSAYTTFMSDDFYVLMDAEEGLMERNDYGLDLAVGRILAGNLEEAQAMVDKIVDYHAVESQGRWRNQIVALSDDVDQPTDIVLQKSLDEMMDEISAKKPFFNIKKIHMDSYVQEVSAGGKRYPQVQKEFVEALENGALLVNYFGHGGEDGLAAERVFGIVEAQNLNNYKKYPLFVTITCEFTRFDNPYRLTGGESMFKNRRGGAIALVATTREIGIEPGRQINLLLSSKMMVEGEVYPTIAQALMETKNASSSQDKRVVFYIGDPALKLAIAKPKVVLTKINDLAFDDFKGELQALGYVKLAGELRDQNDQFLSNYTGDLAVQIFDKSIDRKTLGNDGVTQNGRPVVMDYTTLGETVFRGNATVKQGRFEFDFVMPKDIKIAVGPGKLSFYAQQQGGGDNSGYNNQVQMGGININAAEDKIPPVIRLFMNDESFISGGHTSEAPVFLAFLEDENGINTSSGIGHDLVAILDGVENSPIVLNDYYETEPDNFRKGKIAYNFKDLENGLHTLSFKAWDVYNNLATAEVQFVVSKDEEVHLEKVLNYPNPFVNYTEFWFTHNRPYENLEAQVQIMTVTGRIVKTINQIISTEGKLSREIKWDGRDDFGDPIGKGVYIYKLTVRSTVSQQKSEKIEKLVIL